MSLHGMDNSHIHFAHREKDAIVAVQLYLESSLQAHWARPQPQPRAGSVLDADQERILDQVK